MSALINVFRQPLKASLSANAMTALPPLCAVRSVSDEQAISHLTTGVAPTCYDLSG